MQLTIRLPDEYFESMEKLAKEMGLKRSDIARLAIREFIANYTDVKQQPPYQRVKHLLGVAESGVSDLGQNHRNHIIDRIRKK